MNTVSLKRTLNYLPAFWLVGLLILISALRWFLPNTIYGIDDANIYFVYSKNLAEGYGLVFNPGGERVEGYTSTLWMLLASAVLALKLPLENSLLLINCALLLIAYSCCFRFLSRHCTDHNRTVILTLLSGIVLFTPGFILWAAASLMENSLWIASQCLLLFSALNRARRHGIFCFYIALSLLVRPESMLFTAMIVVLTLVFDLDQTPTKSLRHRAFCYIGTYILTLAALITFRQFYFGFPFPNTYYAKVDSSLIYNISQGIKYFVGYITYTPFSFACIAILGIAVYELLFNRLKNLLRPVSEFEILTLYSATSLAIPLAFGGDHFAEYRFYQNAYPIVVTTTLYYLANKVKILPLPEASPTRHPPPLGVATVILLLLLAYGAKAYVDIRESNLIGEFNLAVQGRERGANMNLFFEYTFPKPNIGAIAAGSFPYVYDGDIFDVLGLNHVTMGHNSGNRHGIKNSAAFNKEVFYAFAPDILAPQFYPIAQPITESGFVYGYMAETLKQIFLDEKFKALFIFTSTQRSDGQLAKKKLTGWYRRDFLNDLLASGYYTEPK